MATSAFETTHPLTTSLLRSDDFLSLPKKYDVTNADVVELSSGGEGIDAGRVGAGTVLVAKICDALVNAHGYDETVAQKVGRLVATNTMTVDSAQVESEEDTNEDDKNEVETSTSQIANVVARILDRILDKQVLRSRTVHFNSNEPVLLVNGGERISLTRLHHVVDETRTQLQHDRHIWPVRVYAGKFWPVDGQGFSISLLNVVNTDIGGPSMVQLLDAKCDALEWCRYARREVWRERDLIIREDGDFADEDNAALVEDDRSERSVHSEHTTSTSDDLHPEEVESFLQSQSQVVADRFPEAEARPNDDTAFTETPKGGLSAQGLPDDPEEIFAFDAPDVEEQPEYPPAPERKISYPTWDRSHDGVSLIDLIRSQALDISPLETQEWVKAVDQDEAVAEPLPPASESKADDEFVLL